MDRDIYQKQYDFELEQRNSIASSTNTPIVSITIVGGAISSMLLSFPYSKEPITYLFLAFALLAIVSTIVGVAYIFKSVIGYSYQKIPSSVALAKHFQDLKDWHTENGTDGNDIVKETKKDFDDYFESKLSQAADHNGNNNIKRGNYIHDSTIAVAFSLALMGMSSPFYIYAKSIAVEGTHKVEVVNPISFNKEVISMAEKENSGKGGNSGTQGAAPAQQPAAPAQTAKPKPSGPDNIVFKGSVDTTAKTMSIPKGTSSNGNKK